MGDRCFVVAVLAHHLSGESRVVNAALLSPVVIAVATGREVLGRNVPSSQMLGARRDFQEVGGLRIKRHKPRRHPLGIDDLECALDPVNHHLAGVVLIRGVDRCEKELKFVVRRRHGVTPFPEAGEFSIRDRSCAGRSRGRAPPEPDRS